MFRWLLNYLLCSRAEPILIEIKAQDRSRIGDSAPQYCGGTQRSAESGRHRQDGIFQQPLREKEDEYRMQQP